MPPLSIEKVAAGFGKSDLVVLNEKEELLKWLMEQSYENVNLLLMSSGNYDGLDMITFANKLTQ